MNFAPAFMSGTAAAPAQRWSPLPPFVADVSETEVRRILSTPTGKKVLTEALTEMEAKIKEDAVKAVTGVWNDRLSQAEDYVGVLGLISHIRALELELEARKDPDYEVEYKKKNADGTFETVKFKPKGWQKTHFSVEEIVKALMDHQEEAVDKMGGVGTKLKPHYDQFLNDYGEEVVTNSYNLNVELDLEQYDFVEDDSPFKYMTAWQIYDEGIRIGDNATRYMSTVVDAMVLLKHPTMKKLLDWFMRERNKMLNSITNLKQVDDMVSYLRTRKIEVPYEWEKDMKLMLKYGELCHGVYEAEGGADG